MKPATIDYITITTELIRAGLYHAKPSGYQDITYAPPRSDWLTGEFYAFFRATLAALNTLTYVPESGDCDDFAEQYVSWAKTCHRRMPHCDGLGLPVGVLFYRQDSGGGHAVVIAITSDRGLVVIEPQNGQIFQLTETEKLSAWHIRL
jgi:hypothetical protein